MTRDGGQRSRSKIFICSSRQQTFLLDFIEPKLKSLSESRPDSTYRKYAYVIKTGRFNISASSDSCSNSKTKESKSHLSMMHLNIQSIKPKIDIIQGTLCDFDILCFTESWLNQNISDKEISLEGYNPPFRNDRSDRLGGGVIVYCKNTLYSKRRTDLEPNGLECIWIETTLNKEKYLIGTIYRPPNSNNHTWDLIEHSIEQAIVASNTIYTWRILKNDPYCLCGEIETTSHYFLHCQRYHNLRVNLENELNFPITYNVLLFGEADRDFEFNKNVFIAVQNFILNSKRFT